jgi:very-short-patch-repair endonuclease
VSAGEETLAMMLRAYGVEFEREYRFAPPRRWRADFCVPSHRLLIEVEGGVYSNGRHSRGSGFEADCEKYNAAAMDGWTVLRYSTRMVKSGEAVAGIMEYLQRAGPA